MEDKKYKDKLDFILKQLSNQIKGRDIIAEDIYNYIINHSMRDEISLKIYHWTVCNFEKVLVKQDDNLTENQFSKVLIVQKQELKELKYDDFFQNTLKRIIKELKEDIKNRSILAVDVFDYACLLNIDTITVAQILQWVYFMNTSGRGILVHQEIILENIDDYY